LGDRAEKHKDKEIEAPPWKTRGALFMAFSVVNECYNIVIFCIDGGEMMFKLGIYTNVQSFIVNMEDRNKVV
jgi:hypothetical protein